MQFDKEKALKAAEKFSQQGNYSAAITEYQKIIAAEPANYMAINTLGDLFVRAGQNQEAIQHFFAVAEEYRKSGFAVKAIAMYKKINKLDPSYEDVYLKLAELYAQQMRIVDARQQYTLVADALKSKGQLI